MMQSVKVIRLKSCSFDHFYFFCVLNPSVPSFLDNECVLQSFKLSKQCFLVNRHVSAPINILHLEKILIPYDPREYIEVVR